MSLCGEVVKSTLELTVITNDLQKDTNSGKSISRESRRYHGHAYRQNSRGSFGRRGEMTIELLTLGDLVLANHIHPLFITKCVVVGS